MATRGRPRKPIPSRLLEGTYRADRHGEIDAAWLPEGAIDKPPAWMTGDAKALWTALAKQLSDAKVATEVDAAELAALCDWWQRYRDAAKAADKVKDKQSVQYYRLTILASMAWKNFASAAAKFGLNPSDRAKLRLGSGPKAEDELLEFAAKRV